jgi:hypothetical protein
MSLSKNQIQIKNFGGVLYEERIAAEAGIKPGMLCKVNSAGKVIKHDSAGGKVENLIAIEDSLQGKTVDDAYAINTPVRLVWFRPGEEFHGLADGGTNITLGEQVCSAGNGMHRSASDSGSYTAYANAVALEANVSTSHADQLIRMRAL